MKNISPTDRPELDDELINEFTKTNTSYYRYKWKIATGFSKWNWTATLLGPLWFAFRRLPKTAILLAALMLWFDFWITTNPFHITFSIELLLLSGFFANYGYLKSFKKYLKKPTIVAQGVDWKTAGILGIAFITLLLVLPSLFGIQLLKNKVIKIEIQSLFYTLIHPEIRTYEIDLLREDYQKAYFSGDFKRSLAINKNTLKLSENKLGKNHQITAALQSELITNTLEAGKYKEALDLTNDLMNQYQLKFGQNHLFTTFLTNNLVSNYIYQGRFDLAKSQSYNCLLIWEKYPKNIDHPVILSQKASIYSNMGVIQQAFCNYNEAERYHLEALQLTLRATDGYTLSTCHFLTALGNYYKERFDLQKAEYYYNKSQNIIEQLLKTPNPMISSIYTRLGELHFLKHRYNPALKWLKKANDINNLIFSNTHVISAETQYLQGKVYFSKGNLFEAEKHLNKAIAIIDSHLGAENSIYATYTSTLADFYIFRNNYNKAYGILKKSLVTFESIYGVNNPRLIFILKQLATIAEDQSNPKEALDHLRHIQQIKKQVPFNQLPEPKHIQLDRESIVI